MIKSCNLIIHAACDASSLARHTNVFNRASSFWLFFNIHPQNKHTKYNFSNSDLPDELVWYHYRQLTCWQWSKNTPLTNIQRVTFHPCLLTPPKSSQDSVSFFTPPVPTHPSPPSTRLVSQLHSSSIVHVVQLSCFDSKNRYYNGFMVTAPK